MKAQSPRFIARIAAILLLCLAGYGVAVSNIPYYSGDANRDGALDIADVVTLETHTATTDTLGLIDFMFHDANQDNLVDSADMDHTIDILLGRVGPLPWYYPAPAAASVWVQAGDIAPQASDIDPAAVSVWYQAGDAAPQASDVQPAAVSVWYQAGDAAPQASDVPPAAVSVWVQGSATPDIEHHSVLLGWPSYDRE